MAELPLVVAGRTREQHRADHIELHRLHNLLDGAAAGGGGSVLAHGQVGSFVEAGDTAPTLSITIPPDTLAPGEVLDISAQGYAGNYTGDPVNVDFLLRIDGPGQTNAPLRTPVFELVPEQEEFKWMLRCGLYVVHESYFIVWAYLQVGKMVFPRYWVESEHSFHGYTQAGSSGGTTSDITTEIVLDLLATFDVTSAQANTSCDFYQVIHHRPEEP